MRAHLAACAECASRKSDLEALLATNRDALASLERKDPPTTTADEIVAIARRGRNAEASPASRRFLRAASIALLVATAAVAAAMPGSPFRDAAVRLVENLRPVGEPDSTPGIPPTAGVALQPSDRLVVVFASGQVAGAVEIALVPTSTARVETSDQDVSFSVANDSIAVDNQGSTASYVVTVPEGLSSFEVRVGGATVFRKSGTTVDALRPMRQGRTAIPFSSIE